MIILTRERASCPMNTHWNTVWSNRQSKGAFPVFLYGGVCCSSACCASSAFTSKSMFPGLGFESQSRQFFSDVTPATTHNNQSKKLSENILNWLTVTGKLREKTTEKWSRLGFEPKPGNVKFEVELELPVCWIAAHAVVEENRESALWLPIASQCSKRVFVRQLALSASRLSCPEG